MTHELEWKIAKFLKKNGSTKRSEMPEWVPEKLQGQFKYFRVYTPKIINGYPSLSPDDTFTMEDADLDAYKEEKKRRIHAFRDWLEPAGVVVANIIALAALVISIIALGS